MEKAKIKFITTEITTGNNTSVDVKTFEADVVGDSFVFWNEMGDRETVKFSDMDEATTSIRMDGAISSHWVEAINRRDLQNAINLTKREAVKALLTKAKTADNAEELLELAINAVNTIA
jgi:hypothetical protein